MKNLLRTISFASLAAMFTASILVFNGRMDRRTYYVWALLGTIGWFATVPFWMKRRLHHS